MVHILEKVEIFTFAMTDREDCTVSSHAVRIRVIHLKISETETSATYTVMNFVWVIHSRQISIRIWANGARNRIRLCLDDEPETNPGTLC